MVFATVSNEESWNPLLKGITQLKCRFDIAGDLRKGHAWALLPQVETAVLFRNDQLR